MNFLIVTLLVNLVVKVAAEPSPWLYEKIHLLSDKSREASSKDRVKKFQIPAINATHQNNTETSLNNTLDTQHKKQDDNQTDAVAKLYSFLKFTSQTKDNTTAGSDDNATARNTSLLIKETSPVADTASPSGNNVSLAGNTTLAGKNVTQGSLIAANGSQSAGSLSDLRLNQQNPPSANATSPFISQTTSLSYRPSIAQYVGDKGAALTQPLNQLGTSAQAASVQPPRSYVPNRPLGYGTSIPGAPNNYLSGRWSVPISGSRTYATAWSQGYMPNKKAVFRTPVAGLKSYVPNRGVLRSPIPGQPRYIPNQAVLRSPIPRRPSYTLNHAVLRPASNTPNQAVLRSPIPGTPNRAVLRSPIPGQPRYMPNRLPVHGGILSHTPYLPYARRHSVPNIPYRGGHLRQNPPQLPYARRQNVPYSYPFASKNSRPSHLRQNPPQLPYARRQNVPYSYPFASKNSRPSLPGQKRTYMYGNVGQRTLPHAVPPPRLTRPVYTRHQVPVPRFAYRG